MSQPLVTVVVVCHNDRPHLETALDSALCQTHPAVEVVLVDNGSSDGAAAMAAERYGDRVRVHRQANLGAAAGRNAGLRLAQGEFVQLLDGDDFLAPNKLERQVAALVADPEADVAVGGFRCFRSDPTVPAHALQDGDSALGDDIRATLIESCPGPPIAFLFRRRLVGRIGYQNVRLYNEDYEYWLRAAFAGCRFVATPDAFGFYRRRAGQKSQHRWRLALADYAVFRAVEAYAKESPHRELVAAKLRMLERAFAHHFLHQGDRRRAGKLLGRLERLGEGAGLGARLTAAMAALPGGDAAYRSLRWLRRLPAPFAAHALPAPTVAG